MHGHTAVPYRSPQSPEQFQAPSSKPAHRPTIPPFRHLFNR